MAGDFQVDVAALRGYAKALADDTAVANEVAGFVGQSDVGDQSWGVVGLFVKSKYTEMLGDLTDLVRAMGDGLRSGSDRVTATADGYQAADSEIQRVMADLLAQLDTARTSSMGK